MNIDKLHIVESGALSVSERKASLRSYMKKRRGENENRDVKEALLLENFLKSGAAERESFFVYMSFSSEAPTDKLIAYLLAQNKRVYCPRTEGGEIVPVEYGEDFSLSPYGIREPLGKAYEGKIERGGASPSRGGRKRLAPRVRQRILRQIFETAPRNETHRLLFRFSAGAGGPSRGMGYTRGGDRYGQASAACEKAGWGVLKDVALPPRRGKAENAVWNKNS